MTLKKIKSSEDLPSAKQVWKAYEKELAELMRKYKSGEDTSEEIKKCIQALADLLRIA